MGTVSLASDRAEVITIWMRAESVRLKRESRRLVFLMPRETFNCRIVALAPDSELLDWLEYQGARFVGEFGRYSSPGDIETAIWRAWKVPRGTAAMRVH